MGYVMVPVPEEHVEAVERYLRWGVGRSKLDLDSQALAEILRSVDDEERELLGLVARRVLDEMPLSIKQVQSRFGWNSREVVAAMLDVNQHAVARGQDPQLLTVRASSAADDVPEWFGDSNVLVMDDHIAEIVADLVAAGIGGDGDEGDGSSGDPA